MYADPALIREMQQWLDYEPETGIFRWKRARAIRTKVGAVAGRRDPRGYIRLPFNYTNYMAHRVAWAFTHGVWPQYGIDHINGEKADNRIVNLRDVSQSVNMQNQRRAPRNSSTGLLGVSPNSGKFAAHIVSDGRKVYLGRYDTPEAAHAVYINAKRVLHVGCAI